MYGNKKDNSGNNIQGNSVNLKLEGWILKQVQKHFLKKIIYLDGHRFEYYCKIVLKWWLPSWWLF